MVGTISASEFLPEEFMADQSTWDAALSSFRLAPQEARVAEMIVHGFGDKQIARAMGIGISTLRTYITRAFERTGASSRTELAVHVMQRLMRAHAQKERDAK